MAQHTTDSSRWACLGHFSEAIKNWLGQKRNIYLDCPEYSLGCRKRIEASHEVDEGHGLPTIAPPSIHPGKGKSSHGKEPTVEWPCLLTPLIVSIATHYSHGPPTLQMVGDQLSKPKHRSLNGSQSNTQGFPLVFRELAATALQLNTYRISSKLELLLAWGTHKQTETLPFVWGTAWQ